MADAMETASSPEQSSIPIVDESGRMCIEVAGEEVTTEDYVKKVGWKVVTRKKKPKEERAQGTSPQTQSHMKTFARKAPAAATMAARVPNLLPKEDNKVVVRPDDNLIICGDFNAHNQARGYIINNAKGTGLQTDATEEGPTLITDPTYPTRTGNSACRDTTTDLTFIRISQGGRTPFWINTGDNLGSDHLITEVTIPLKRKSDEKRIHKLTDWDLYRTLLPGKEEEIQDVDEWANKILENVTAATKEIETDVEIGKMDSHLAHMLEAKTSIHKRWQNRRLRKKVAELNHANEKHCRSLCRQLWNEMCSAADGQLHEEIHKQINYKYLPEHREETHPDYRGMVNETLHRDIETWEVRMAVHELNSRSAAGPDKVTNKALKHLNEAPIASLTALFNKCWSEGKLLQTWKTAKTIVIPKPGKPPGIENLRSISLTSCVGKLLEHVLVNRWQEYLEDNDLYPDSMIGFRSKLSTQHAILQINTEILNDETKTKDNKPILGLHLQSAFDKLKHSAILAQFCALNMGAWTYDYVRDFLKGRTTKIQAGDETL
ncbi:uncharacterized protein LOC144180056 [Haemaphysalis longicornis]